jgi:hypothetical protein
MIFAELKEKAPYSKSTQIELSSNLACEFHVLDHEPLLHPLPVFIFLVVITGLLLECL